MNLIFDSNFSNYSDNFCFLKLSQYTYRFLLFIFNRHRKYRFDSDKLKRHRCAYLLIKRNWYLNIIEP